MQVEMRMLAGLSPQLGVLSTRATQDQIIVLKELVKEG